MTFIQYVFGQLSQYQNKGHDEGKFSRMYLNMHICCIPHLGPFLALLHETPFFFPNFIFQTFWHMIMRKNERKTTNLPPLSLCVVQLYDLQEKAEPFKMVLSHGEFLSFINIRGGVGGNHAGQCLWSKFPFKLMCQADVCCVLSTECGFC